jgi:C4-dicarboxylate-specific signal transduction histidine kinase
MRWRSPLPAAEPQLTEQRPGKRQQDPSQTGTWPIGLNDHVAVLSQELLRSQVRDQSNRALFDPQHVESIGRQIAALPDPIEMLANVVANAPVGLAIWDLAGNVLLANRRLVEMFGSRPPPNYNVFQDGIAEQLGVAAAMRRASTGEVVELPTFWYDPHQRSHEALGKRIAVSLSVLPIFDSQGCVHCLASVYRDNTTVATAQQQLKAQSEQLEQHIINRTAELEEANEELEAFAYSVSHDLRAPLRAIDGFAALLAEDGESQLSDRGQECVHRIRAATTRLSDLINDLLAFARLGRQALNFKTVQPAELVRQVLDELAPQRQGRNVDIQIGELPAVQADSVLLREVFLNLLDNAIKFTARTETAVVQVGSNVVDGQLIWFVADNGVGFDMEHYDRLFAVFSRLHSPEEFEGTGVGLAVVHRIVKRHGGQIWAHARPNLGASFYFTLGELPA